MWWRRLLMWSAPVTDVVASVPDLVAPVTDVLTPVSDVIASVQYMPTSVAGAVVPLTQPPSDLSSFLLGIAGVAPVTDVLTPVSDVIALVQYMLTSVADAVVPLAQLPSDLFSFLLGIAGVAPVVDGVGGIHGPGLSAAAGASVASRLPLGLPLAGISGVPVAGNATGVATLDVISLGRVSAVSGMAPQAPNAAIPMGAESFFPHVFDEFLLPFHCGRWPLSLCPAWRACYLYPGRGARGYRQAKAGVAFRTTGIAGFARPAGR